MAIQWPLVLFSLLAGAGGAMLAFAGLSQLLGGSRTVRRRAVWCALALFVIGGLCSVAHLASPLNAISAVTNLLSFSGISIELMLLGASFIAGAAYLVLTREEGRDGAVRVVAVLAVIFGVAIGFFCGHGQDAGRQSGQRRGAGRQAVAGRARLRRRGRRGHSRLRAVPRP